MKAVGELWNSGEKEPGKAALEIIITHYSASATARNPNPVLVKFSSVFHDEDDRPGGTPALLEACKEYFAKTGTKSACFEDLKVYLGMFEEIETEEFFKFVGERVSGMSDSTEVHLRSMFGQDFDMLALSFRRGRLSGSPQLSIITSSHIS